MEIDDFMLRLTEKLNLVRRVALMKAVEYEYNRDNSPVFDDFEEIRNMLFDITDLVSEFDSKRKHTEKS